MCMRNSGRSSVRTKDNYRFKESGETVSGWVAHKKLNVGDWEKVEASDDGHRWVILDEDGEQRTLEYIGDGDTADE